MKKFLLLMLPFVFALNLHASTDLWEKAVSIAEDNSNWVPGIITVNSKIMNKKGKIKEESKFRTRLYLDEAGEVQNEILEVIENGEEVTQSVEVEIKKKDEESSDKDEKESGNSVSISSDDADIFDPENQASIKVKATGLKGVVDGRPCTSFEFALTSENGTLEGSAWLEEETGIPLEVQFSQTPLPKHVKSMETTLRYNMEPDGKWR